MIRMNLNTFSRHGVYDRAGALKKVAGRLRDAKAISRSRVFPYQLLTSYRAASGQPEVIRNALETAMQIALGNVPGLTGRVVVCPDVSGSMQSPVTGWRPGATGVTRCVDVAALLSAAVLQRNREARVLPFEHKVVDLELNVQNSVMANSDRLSRIGGGGTDTSAPLRLLNRERAKVDLVILVSDNESWIESGRYRSTDTLAQWEQLKARNPGARLVCIDIQPYATTQAPEREDILNIGGFSDRVFELVGLYAAGKLRADHWVGLIEAGGMRAA